VIDLAADFRLDDADLWEQWYGMPHACPELLNEAVYGLPEMNRDGIKGAKLVANPGCYPTAVTLGYMPLIKAGLLASDGLVADVKSGVSGAGRKAAIPTLMGECGESFKAYGVPGHRHLPEISQSLAILAGGSVSLTFVPHLVPMVRGICATLYGRLVKNEDLQSLFNEYYAEEPFVDVMPIGDHPETRSVRGTNICRIGVHQPQGGDTVVVLSVIDNLVKGAAGQAVQNMNLMFGLEEKLGLNAVALLP
jgi:N-acetyl-gamma-glutamyl-phosphate reductase